MQIGKYSFDSKEQVQAKIDTLNEEPNKHTFVHLGNIVLEQGEYDSEGEETKAPVLSAKWHLDVLWADEEGHPYGWATRAVDLDNEGSHSFFGVSYISNKM